MKRSVFILLLAIISSCGGNSSNVSKSSYLDINISMDTVVVDSGDEILMAATNEYGHHFNEDRSKSYFWDSKSNLLEIIDLEEMRLQEKKQFQKEGPNGVGQFPFQMMLVDDDKVGFIDLGQFNVADMKTEVLSRIKMNEDWMKEKIGEKESLGILGFTDGGNIMYCSISNYNRLNSNILKVDLENQTTALIELPEYDKRDKFKVSFLSENGNMMSMTYPTLELTKYEDQLIFHSDAFSGIYKLDPVTEVLSYHQISNTLTANEKTGTYQNEVTSPEEMEKVMSEMREEVSFSALFWDKEKRVFYRFTSFDLPRVADEKVKSRVFISIIDEDFEVIGEKEISQDFKSVPDPLFIKDGRIHSFLNADDELGYVRIKIN
ncbi:DUF4221 family protein [Belliella pelovolcani]|uniref:DUF4221 family protein n=1 Tax=Belliella pelovolcani TaxID=529505 RepID=UPI00391C74DF